MKFYLVILKILILAALLIISNNNLHLSDEQERGVFFDAYGVWVNGLFDHVGSVVGYVVKFEWLPSRDSDSVEEIKQAKGLGS